MNNAIPAVLAIITGIIGIAIIAVIVSRNSQTPSVLQSAGQALASVISAAVSPVTGSGGGGAFGNTGTGLPGFTTPFGG